MFEIKLTTSFCPFLNNLQVIKDHPLWWVLLTFDGFKSHVNVLAALQKFYEAKIRAAKEDGGTSATNQAYDQQQAKQDKSATRQLLDMARSAIEGRMDQWQLVGVIATAIKNLPEDIWEKSFISVNLHPHHRVPFEDWIEKISNVVTTGEKNYMRTNEASYFDAMPALWKKMTVETRRRVVDMVDGFVATAVGTESPWRKENVLQLVRFCPLADVPKLRTCYMVAKEHPDVLDGRRRLIASDAVGEENAEGTGEGNNVDADSEDEGRETGDVQEPDAVQDARGQLSLYSLSSYSLKPPPLLPPDFRTNPQAQKNLVKHMCNFGARAEWESGKRQVSEWLDVEVSSDQERLLNPTALDTIQGYILQASSGKEARKRLPQRRLNLIDGCINSYSSVLNSDGRMKLIKEANELAAVLADIDNDRQAEKEARKERLIVEEEEKKRKAEEKREREQRNRDEAVGVCATLIGDLRCHGPDHVSKLTVPYMKTLLRYHFNTDDYKGRRKAELVQCVRQRFLRELKETVEAGDEGREATAT